MSYDEFKSWIAFRRKRGPLNAMMRIDYGFAQVCAVLMQTLGGVKNVKLNDLLLWKDEGEDDGVATLADVAQMLGVRSNGKP